MKLFYWKDYTEGSPPAWLAICAALLGLLACLLS